MMEIIATLFKNNFFFKKNSRFYESTVSQKTNSRFSK